MSYRNYKTWDQAFKEVHDSITKHEYEMAMTNQLFPREDGTQWENWIGLSKINNMKNINKSTGYLIVIIFWLVTTLMLSSCALQKGGGCGGNPFQEGY